MMIVDLTTTGAKCDQELPQWPFGEGEIIKRLDADFECPVGHVFSQATPNYGSRTKHVRWCILHCEQCGVRYGVRGYGEQQ